MLCPLSNVALTKCYSFLRIFFLELFAVSTSLHSLPCCSAIEHSYIDLHVCTRTRTHHRHLTTGHHRTLLIQTMNMVSLVYTDIVLSTRHKWNVLCHFTLQIFVAFFFVHTHPHTHTHSLTGVYLVKQVLRSKHRIRLLDYELNNLHKLKLRLAKEWRSITEKAEVDVR